MYWSILPTSFFCVVINIEIDEFLPYCLLNWLPQILTDIQLTFYTKCSTSDKYSPVDSLKYSSTFPFFPIYAFVTVDLERTRQVRVRVLQHSPWRQRQ